MTFPILILSLEVPTTQGDVVLTAVAVTFWAEESSVLPGPNAGGG
jgi:hypothetical protein